MIVKRISIVDKTVKHAEEVAVVNAISLESGLSRIASMLSIWHDKNCGWMDVLCVFTSHDVGFEPSDKCLVFFSGAVKEAYRMETSLIFLNDQLTLRIKLYFKNERKEFLEWRIVFNSLGKISESEMVGGPLNSSSDDQLYGRIGKLLRDKRGVVG